MSSGGNMQKPDVAPAPGPHAKLSETAQAEYPVRGYIADMAADLARMARWDGDEQLASALELVVRLAAERPR